LFAPKISVIVPALNEAARIEDCLRALKQQDYPQDRYEIIVVDNGSVDDTPAIAKRHQVQVLHENRRSAYFARNTAIKQSQGDYLAFTDADCVADRSWLTSFVDAAERSPELIAGGLILYDVELDNLANKLLAERKEPARLRENVEVHGCVACGNMFVSRSLFEKHGLFRTVKSGADIDFSRRVARAGCSPKFRETAIVRHKSDFSNAQFLKRNFGEQFGQARLSETGGAFSDLLGSLARVPWRPGLSHLAGGFPNWGYRWLDRWYSYMGRLQGAYDAWREGPAPVPSYGEYR
jgi:glycosyltransferase involved in cell wall biosynthesis